MQRSLVFVVVGMLALRSAAWVSARQFHPFLPHPSSLFVATRRMAHRTSHPSARILHSQKHHDDTIIQDSSKYRKYYGISGTGQRSVVKMETNTGHTLQTDVPTNMGGSDTAPQPVETLLAALLGCTQATSIYVGRMMKPRLIIDKIEFVDINAYRDERGALELPIDDVLPTIPARLQYVSGTINVYFKKGMHVTEEQLSILAKQTEARCPVANMMHASGCVMDIKWVNGNVKEEST